MTIEPILSFSRKACFNYMAGNSGIVAMLLHRIV